MRDRGDAQDGRIMQLCPPTQGKRSTILVSGGAGYIGSLLVRRLLRRGYRVRVLDCLLYGDGALREVLGHPDLELVIADFRQSASLWEALRGVDAVIHLGAIVGDPACTIDEAFTIETNFEAARAIGEACKAVGIRRLLFASTCSVYGASNEVLDEGSALNPVSLYAETKIAAEHALRVLQDEIFQPTILRLATVYGISPRLRFDLVVNLLAAKAVTEGVITIYGGEQWRPFVHVDDIGRGFILALEAPLDLVGGQTLNLGSNEQNCRLAQIGEIIGDIVPGVEIRTNHTIIDERNYYVRFDKIRHLLGFQPDRGLRDGVRELKTACESGDTITYSDPRHNNYRFLREIRPDACQPIGMASTRAWDLAHQLRTIQGYRINDAAESTAVTAGDD